jgi:CheY-like chemotaxis protein
LARKILLADDSVTAQNMGRRILSDAGYDVITVNNGSAALKKIAESKPDLIVLDVYMPGYGGLEVCQRLREAPETARIPVLLTVGKLEPFKADEARRVRADGFIVKPFEASELLTALTKLEDKIVPQSQPGKPSRFAKALAGADEAASGKEFGDSETGWKNRLSIPPPYSKPRAAASEESVDRVREASRNEEHKPAEMKSGLEEALLSSMPQDVTAEEIAAIKAAAAAFSAQSDESSFAAQLARDHVESALQESPATPQESVRESDAEGVSAVASSAVTGREAVAEPVPAVEVRSETAPLPATITSESAVSIDSQIVNADAGRLGDDEVTAALASLAPANGHGAGAVIENNGDKLEVGSTEQIPVTMAVAGAAQEFSGPRWIAEPVSVGEDEATLILEQEMEKAYAAFAAADGARMSFASSPAAPRAFLEVVEARANDSVSSSPLVESSASLDSGETTPAERAAASSEELVAAELSPVTASSSVDAVGQSSSEVDENAAFAAAASAGPSMVEATTVAEATLQPSPVVESSENVAPTSDTGARQGESELAAAWANWKQIRESVIGSQVSAPEVSSQIADTVAEIKEDSSEASESRPEASSATEEETSEISSIVDSVLAELKPKLMAEIARKMGKEKK